MKKFKKIMALILMMVMILALGRIDLIKAKTNEDYTNGPNLEIKSLSKNQEESLFKLCKVWGFAKYYHLEVASGKLDWDAELFKIMPEVLKAEDSNEVDKIIFQWINNLGYVENVEETISKNVKIPANTEWIRDTNFIGDDLSNLLIKIEGCKKLEKSYYVELEQFDNPKFKNEKQYEKMSYSDDGVKLLSLFRYWNIIEYFNPNRHLMDENWDSVLKQFIPKIVNEDSELGYKLNIYELIGKIQDGHASIDNVGKVFNDFFGNNTPPFAVGFIEGKVVVTNVLKDIPNLNVKVGDVILKLDGKDTKDVIKEREKYIPPTSTNYNNFALKYLFLRTNNNYLNLTIERDNSVIEEKVPCSKDYYKIYQEYEKKPSHTIKDNILYIAPGYLVKDEIHDIMKKSMDTKGMIVDLRQYPADSINYKLAAYLMPKKVEFVKCSRANMNKPGEFLFTETIKVGSDNPNYYKGKVILLINENTVSHGEFTAMALRKAPMAIVLGSNSFGADGNVSSFMLPGKITTGISGIGIYYPDGTETQKVGIVPDVEVKPTIKGLKEGRDELIEKAIELINQ